MSYGFDVREHSELSKKIKKNWISSHQYIDASQPLESVIDTLKSLDTSNIHTEGMVVVFSTEDFKPLYVCKGVEKILGYTKEEFLGWEEGAFFKIGAFNQPEYFPKLIEWEADFRKKSPHKEANVIGRGYFCGVRYKRKDGTSVRFLLRHEAVFGANFKMPFYDILYFTDISHLIKSDDFWMLFKTYDNEEMFARFYRKEGIDNYIITPRETQIIKLIAAGKSTKEVASELFISPETVGQHRKNMIKKTMARDTSSLIHLLKICEVI